VISAGIDLSQPDLLAKALRFNDRQYEPMDTVEFQYEVKEQHSSDILLTVQREVRSLRARAVAEPFRRKILNLLRIASDQRVILDLDGITFVSSSFADEVFGKLFAEIGPTEFAQRIELRNVQPTVRQLIDRSIVQRTKSG
jgi:anti-anti-sigma regulatory factor